MRRGRVSEALLRHEAGLEQCCARAQDGPGGRVRGVRVTSEDRLSGALEWREGHGAGAQSHPMHLLLSLTHQLSASGVILN